MKKYFSCFILTLVIALLLVIAPSAKADCTITPPPVKPAGCNSSDCGSKGWCGCDLSTTSDYSCMNSSNGADCKQGLCPGAASKQCCKAKTAGGAGAGGGGAGGNLGPLLPACAATGRCSLCDLIQVAINFGEFLFGIVGALVLLYFFYGGFLMLTSAGEGGKVKKGKDVLVNSVIGLLIVFLAYSGVNFIIGAVAKTGWNWTTILTAPKACAPLPAAIPWTAPSAGQGAGGPPNTSSITTPEGQTITAPTTCTGTVVGAGCSSNNSCTGCGAYYCDNAGKCQNQLEADAGCKASSTKDGNANVMCKSGNCNEGEHKCSSQTSLLENLSSTICTKGSQCKGGTCSFGKCVNADGTGPLGTKCNDSAQCVSTLFCDGGTNGDWNTKGTCILRTITKKFTRCDRQITTNMNTGNSYVVCIYCADPYACKGSSGETCNNKERPNTTKLPYTCQ